MFSSHKLVGTPGLAWKKQKVITVAFQGGSDDLYALIERTANEWTSLGGQLQFSFRDKSGRYRQWTSSDKSPAANIRIAFNAGEDGGYWSLLGVLAKNVGPGDPTMNFEGFPQKLQKYFAHQNDSEWVKSYEHSTILHEFGHALGLSHEHFNPQCQKDLRMDDIIAYLMGPPNDWPEEQARFNMDAQYYMQVLEKQAGPLESKLVTSATTDQSSVMLYVFPASYYHSGDKSACKPIGDSGKDYPTTLSAGDKEFYLANYKTISSPFGDNSAVTPPSGRQIDYLSDTDDAYKYLENLQRAIYEENPQLTDPFSREELNNPRTIASFADLRERASKACQDPTKREECALDPVVLDKMIAKLSTLSLPTRFESPLFSFAISLYTGELDPVKSNRFPTSARARFGSLPTGIIDAQAILPPGSKDPLVILNRDIFFFTGVASKWVSDAIPISKGQSVSLDYSEEGIRKRLQEHPYIVTNFADAVSRMVSRGSSVGAVEITLDEDHNHIHGRLVSAMDIFIIAHEDAHVILQHISDESTPLHLAGSAAHRPVLPPVSELRATAGKVNSQQVESPSKSPSATVRVQRRTQTQELEADALGFKLLMWAGQDGKDPIGQMMAAAAPSMVFRMLDLADTYAREAGGWSFSDSNHPVLADRIKALDPVFDEMAKQNQFLRQVDFRIPFEAAFKVLAAEADAPIRQKLGLPMKSKLSAH